MGLALKSELQSEEEEQPVDFSNHSREILGNGCLVRRDGGELQLFEVFEEMTTIPTISRRGSKIAQVVEL